MRELTAVFRRGLQHAAGAVQTDDLTQETFLRAYRNRASLRSAKRESMQRPMR